MRESALQLAVDAATACLGAGLDNEPLRELAGLPPTTGAFETGALLEKVFAEFDADYPELNESDAIVLVLRHYAHLYMDGSLSARELSAWAHSSIGHEGPSETSPIVEMDDDLDLEDLDIGRKQVDSTAIVEEFLSATETIATNFRPRL